MSPDGRSLTALPRTECLRLLRTVRVGRAIFTFRALPAVVLIPYGVDGDALFMWTGADTRLASAADNGVIVFQADELDPASRSGWSVVVTGVAEIVRDPEERPNAAVLVESWAAPGIRDVLVCLPVAVVTGRRIGRDPGHETSRAGSKLDTGSVSATRAASL
jgi:nitroimidazol reductase NimA-like FMN-containing flavoprotein (pyridoxamine 5'-phosphate oxidase superfamily)